MTHPQQQTTHQLMADLLAIHFDIQRHVQEQGDRLTPLEHQLMVDSVTSLQVFLIAWQADAARRGTGRN